MTDTQPSPTPDARRLAGLASQLCGALQEGPAEWPRRHLHLPRPGRRTVVEIVDALFSVLFPGYFGRTDLDADNAFFHVANSLHGIQRALEQQISRALCFVHGEDEAACAGPAAEHAARFMDGLPDIQRTLMTDVIAAFEGDPAATGPDEVIFCYPGLLAIASHRVAHALHRRQVPLIPRIISEHAHSVTGIDIHPGAQIGERFFIDHGTGLVIGETCQIGKRVRLYQGVTLGARSFPLDEQGRPIKGVQRHPIVEDDVVIYAGATLLGRIVVGRGSVIGGNVWLTRSVPPGSTISQSAVRTEAFDLGAGI